MFYLVDLSLVGPDSHARCGNLENNSLTIYFNNSVGNVTRSVCLNAVGVTECNDTPRLYHKGNWELVPPQNDSKNFMNLSPYTEYFIIVSFKAPDFNAIDTTLRCRTMEASKYIYIYKVFHNYLNR